MEVSLITRNPEKLQEISRKCSIRMETLELELVSQQSQF